MNTKKDSSSISVKPKQYTCKTLNISVPSLLQCGGGGSREGLIKITFQKELELGLYRISGNYPVQYSAVLSGFMPAHNNRMTLFRDEPELLPCGGGGSREGLIKITFQKEL